MTRAIWLLPALAICFEVAVLARWLGRWDCE